MHHSKMLLAALPVLAAQAAAVAIEAPKMKALATDPEDDGTTVYIYQPFLTTFTRGPAQEGDESTVYVYQPALTTFTRPEPQPTPVAISVEDDDLVVVFDPPESTTTIYWAATPGATRKEEDHIVVVLDPAESTTTIHHYPTSPAKMVNPVIPAKDPFHHNSMPSRPDHPTTMSQVLHLGPEPAANTTDLTQPDDDFSNSSAA